jgi:hypothetical protein
VVFDSAVDDYFLNHSDFLAKLEHLTALPPGPTRLPPRPDFLVRLTRVPVASIALIGGRATSNGSEITLACDLSFSSREKAILSQGEVGAGMVAGGGPMARLDAGLGLRPPETVLIDERHRLSSGLMGPLRSMPADFPKVSLRRMVLASCSGFLRRTTYVRPVILAGCVQVRSLSGGGGAVCT